MKSELEVEHKYRLDPAAIPAIEAKLPAMGFKRVATENAKDIYFCDKHGHLKARKIVVRIREENGVITLDTKMPLNAERNKSERIEKNYSFSGAGVAEITELLTTLNLEVVCTVIKERMPWETYKDDSRLRVCIDKVETLGTFVEIEVAAAMGTCADDAHKLLNEVLEKLGQHLGEQVTDSYRKLAVAAMAA